MLVPLPQTAPFEKQIVNWLKLQGHGAVMTSQWTIAALGPPLHDDDDGDDDEDNDDEQSSSTV